MKYAKYRDDLAYVVDTQKFIQPDNQPAEWSAYQAWIAAGNTPLDGNSGHPGLPAKTLLSLSDYRMARIGEDVLTALVAKGILALTDLPLPVQQEIQNRQALRARLSQ